MAGPLAGVRVLELATVVLGPLACQLLGDQGADVVKVEPPAGDSNRQVGPMRSPDMGALFLNCNRNKRGVVLDLKHPQGREAALRLAAGADVLVHNYRPAALARLRLQYEDVRAVNPGIVYCGTYGYGSGGPYRDRPAYDDSIQAAAGLAALSAHGGGEPRFVPTILADKTTALAVVAAVNAALYHRARTGEGQQIEVPMFETMVSFVMTEHLWGRTFEPPEGPAGYVRLLSRERRPLPTRDGHLSVLPYLDEHWRAFCRAAGRADLLDDRRFTSLASRLQNIDALYRTLAEVVAQRPTGEWLDLLGAAGVPATPVRTLEELLDDPHLAATGFWRTAQHPTDGAMRVPAPAARFSRTPADVRRLAPRLGEHTREVLREAGYDDAAIDALVAAGGAREIAPAAPGPPGPAC
jgi:crotonobetainyl-CoA:carnitine CoA-transferase CaiB-like acyl-CoA transferase